MPRSHTKFGFLFSDLVFGEISVTGCGCLVRSVLAYFFRTTRNFAEISYGRERHLKVAPPTNGGSHNLDVLKFVAARFSPVT